jgi:hypothetical protein
MNTTINQEKGFENAYYILNSDNKVELHLSGLESYRSLSETAKTAVKRAFVWGRQRGAWVSRSKDSGIPYSMKHYGIPFHGEQERTTYEDARERRIEKAEHKAERHEEWAAARERNAVSLQSEFNKLRKDWAWLTQPNVNTSGGRSFTNSRNSVIARYDKGFEEMKAAQRHEERAAHFLKIASESELKSESYLINRVKENEKNVREFARFTENYSDRLETIDEQSDDWKIWLKARMNFYQTCFEKLEFFISALRELTAQKKEAGVMCAEDIQEKVAGNVKGDVKKYLKEKYGVDLVSFSKAFGVGVNTYYYIKTKQPLPLEYHSGWASDCSAQIRLAKIIADMDAFNQQKA